MQVSQRGFKPICAHHTSPILPHNWKFYIFPPVRAAHSVERCAHCCFGKRMYVLAVSPLVRAAHREQALCKWSVW